VIRTSKHSVDETNKDKLVKYKAFLAEMRRVAAIYVDYFWGTNYEWVDGKGNPKVLDIASKQYHCPPYFDYSLIPVETDLSCRALSSLATQCCGMVKAALEGQNHRQYVYDKKTREGEKISEKLIENMEKFVPVKPRTQNMNLEVSSKCCDFGFPTKEFGGFLKLKSLGDAYGQIKIPVRFHRQSNKWKSVSELKGSFLLCDRKIELRWESFPAKKTEGITVGADQGKTDVLNLGDGQVTPKKDIHGHSLDSIIDVLARRKPGSRNYRRAQRQRENFINWSLNRLNLGNIRHVKLEKIYQMYQGRRVSRKMRRWTYTLISGKTNRMCEELGVQVTEQASAYRSQRCSGCGMVLGRNRKKKEYLCENCGLAIDADYNACLNHEADLPEVPVWLSSLHLNRSEGFFWKPEGFFGADGKELRVPCSCEKVRCL
jgi:hypothetical protein